MSRNAFQLMKQMEVDLGSRVDWVAVDKSAAPPLALTMPAPVINNPKI